MHELILSNFALHIDLNPQEQAYAIAAFQQKMVPKRTFLLRAGNISRDIYFVNRGCLRIFYTDPSGLEHNINFCPENWWASDIVSFFRERPAINAIQALEDSHVFSITLPLLEKLFTDVPKFERFFRILTQNGYEILQRRLGSNLSQTAEERYLRFRRQYPGLEQRIAQKHIASFVGITPAFLSMMRKEKRI